MQFREEDMGWKTPKIIDLASTGIRIYARLDNKPKQEYGIIDRFSSAVIG